MATKIMKGNTYPQKVTSEDGTRTVEVHADFHRQPNRLVMKDNDKTIIEIASWNLDMDKSHIIQDFIENNVDYCHLFIGFSKKYIKPMVEKDYDTKVTIVGESCSFIWKNRYHNHYVGIELSVAGVKLTKQYKETDSKNGWYKKVCSHSIATLMKMGIRDVIPLATKWNIASYSYKDAHFGQIYIINGNLEYRVNKDVYNKIRTAKYLLESGAIEANRIFDLEKKQISFVTKAKLHDAPYVINKVNSNRTIEIEKFKKSYIKEKLQNKAI